MADSLSFQPIINGVGSVVIAVYNQATLAGTICIMPLAEIYTNGGTVGAGNPFDVFDAQALVNTGSIAAATGAISAESTVIANNTGSLVTIGLAIENYESQVAGNTGTIISQLNGTLATIELYTPVNLDATSVPTAGTPVNVLNAGHATKGGFLQNPNAFPIFYSQTGTAGTSPIGHTVSIAAGSSQNLMPSPNAVSVNSGTNAAAVAGYGYT